MTGETLAEVQIPSGGHAPTSREELHAELDALLDAADAEGGRLYDRAFWGFVAELARGRGIADGIGAAASQHIADAGGMPEIPLDDPAGATDAGLAAARMAQWAMLAVLLRQVTEYPGEIAPREFKASMFVAAADNILTGRGEIGAGEHMDLLGLGTQRGSEGQAERRAARRLLVGAVWFEAARNGGTNHAIGKARIKLLQGKVSTDTFKGWVAEVATAKRMTRTELWNEIADAARHGGDRYPYVLTEGEIAELLKQAHWARV
jgi:hypothetical protein